MRWSQYFVPTLREHPAEAEVASHQLLVRAGMIRQLAAGVYSYLPLAWRVMSKIMNIVREEMNRIGAQEFHLPALHPAEIWKESGRWPAMGENMFRLRDRRGAEMCLGMTHEEIFTLIARNEIRSYQQLPQIWYQIQTKFRDEPRPRSGLLRVREFIMKDAYSFDADWEGLDKSYRDQYEAYGRIFDRCGLKYRVVEAASGAMGGRESAEFVVLTEAGEDCIALCEKCDYAANVERAISRLPKIDDDEGPSQPEIFPTPAVRTIKDLVDFPNGASAERQIKTLAYVIDGRLTLILLRGDHELNEAKLLAFTGAIAVRPAHPEEIKAALGAYPGSLGAVGVTQFPVIADLALQGRKHMTTGANRDGYHLRGVDVERDIRVTAWADLRTVQSAEGCPQCDGRLSIQKGLEIGHIFKLGTKYSESLGATVLNAQGKAVPIVMGSYRIGIARVMAAAIELYHDDDGIIWPMALAPFQAVLIPVHIDDEHQREAAEKLDRELREAGVELLYDDRKERAGVKFKDADLIGIPIRITIGPRKIAQGMVEITRRGTKRSEDIRIEEAVRRVKQLIQEEMKAP